MEVTNPAEWNAIEFWDRVLFRSTLKGLWLDANGGGYMPVMHTPHALHVLRGKKERSLL